jgi:hypothetical protein
MYSKYSATGHLETGFLVFFSFQENAAIVPRKLLLHTSQCSIPTEIHQIKSLALGIFKLPT